jgi:uncharacterized protein YndB with AHSA1/START domain
MLAQGAAADVVSASASGFSLKIETLSDSTPDESYRAFTEIARWWDAAHSYGGNPAMLSLEMKPGGAFLEKLPGGGFVKHLEVVYANPGKEIRLLGGLGPLQPMGMHGAMTIQFEEFGRGSKTVLTYNVSGYTASGLESLAPVVDAVQSAQMVRHAAHAERVAQER